jgi:hypothetical protein
VAAVPTAGGLALAARAARRVRPSSF